MSIEDLGTFLIKIDDIPSKLNSLRQMPGGPRPSSCLRPAGNWIGRIIKSHRRDEAIVWPNVLLNSPFLCDMGLVDCIVIC